MLFHRVMGIILNCQMCHRVFHTDFLGWVGMSLSVRLFQLRSDFYQKCEGKKGMKLNVL